MILHCIIQGKYKLVLMKEKSGKFEDTVGKIERAQGKASQKEGGVTFAEKWASPEEGAEELYALWRDYNRRKIGVYKEAIEKSGGVNKERKRVKVDEAKREAIQSLVESDPRLVPLRTAMRARFQDPQVQAIFKRNLEREITAEEELHRKKIEIEEDGGKREVPLWEHYLHQRKIRDEAVARRLEIYSEIFSHREKDPDELTLLEIADLGVRIKVAGKEMQRMEKEDPELAARLSFERLRTYRDELKKSGFIWTPSREKYFQKILEHLVIVNQSNPLLLYGETGTGKTRLVRAASKRLTGKPPYEVSEEAKSDIRPILGVRSIDKDGVYTIYGQLGQAATGKETSRDQKAGDGGIFYMDDAGAYPPDAQRSLIKQLAGRKPGEEISFTSWAGAKEKLAPKFALIESTNLPSEKHPDRQPLPVEVTREFAEINGTIKVEYPPQTPEDPELYEMMLAALMDQNDKIRVPKDELPPAWKEVVDTRTNTKQLELDTDPKVGGTLWRFASFVAEIQKSYEGKTNVLTPSLGDASYLREAVLSPKILVWLQEYRKKRERSSLKSFLVKKLNEWSLQETYPEEDRNLIKKFQEEFQLV